MPPPATRTRRANDWDTERALLLRYHRSGDVRVREELVRRYLPLARELAQRYTHMDEPLDDLIQVACIGLLKALDRFDPERGFRFTSYAAPTILGELKRHFRDTGWAIHVPREMQERALAVGRAAEAVAQRRGGSVTAQQVARELGWSVEEVLDAREAAQTYAARSLDSPVGANEEGDASALLETIGDEDGGYGAVDARDSLGRAWRELPELERRVVQLRFGGHLTQREIGGIVGFSQMHVSRVLRRALGKLSATG